MIVPVRGEVNVVPTLGESPEHRFEVTEICEVAAEEEDPHLTLVYDVRSKVKGQRAKVKSKVQGPRWKAKVRRQQELGPRSRGASILDLDLRLRT